MRKILIILMSCLLAVSCSKEKSEWEKEQEEILNVIVGKWGFSRFSEDSLFTNSYSLPTEECQKQSYLEFRKNGECINYDYCNKESICKYEIINPDSNNNDNLFFQQPGFLCWPRVYATGKCRLYKYSSSILTFKIPGYPRTFYIELKRID